MIKLRNVTEFNGTPRYEVVQDGRVIGEVGRTGSLPSCYRWWNSAGTVSQRTRQAAVQELIKEVAS